MLITSGASCPDASVERVEKGLSHYGGRDVESVLTEFEQITPEARTFEGMKAPKLRGPFRNVRTEPRTFAFKSAICLDSPGMGGAEASREEEVNGTSDGPRAIKFKQGGKRAEGRLARRAEAVRAGRMAALRAVGVAWCFCI